MFTVLCVPGLLGKYPAISYEKQRHLFVAEFFPDSLCMYNLKTLQKIVGVKLFCCRG